MTHLLAVASGKGGAGVTTLAIALGASLTELGLDTTLVDANLTTPNIGLQLGTPNVPVAVHDVLRDATRLGEALYRHAPSGLKVIPGRVSDAGKHHELLKLPTALAVLPSRLAVLDCASGAHPEALAPLAVADETILVTTPELPAVIDTLKLAKRCESYGTRILGVVINRVGQHRNELASPNIQALLGLEVLAEIPNDPAVHEALAIKHPFTYSHPDSPASRAMKRLAARLLGQ